MQPHCNSANGYHHHGHAASSSSPVATPETIMYSANTANYFPAHHHHHHHQVINPAVNPSLTTTNHRNNQNSHQRSNIPHSVDVFPVTRQSQAVSPAITTSSASATPSSTPSSTSVNPSNTVNVVSNVTAIQNQNHYPPNLYSPSAIEYGITTSGSPNGPAVDYEAFYHQPTETAGSGVGGTGTGVTTPAGHADPNIISTDSGLSYTNLDYMYGNQGQHANTGGDLPGYSLGEDCSPSGSTNTPPASAPAWLTSGGVGSVHGNQGGHMLMHNHLQSGGHHPSPPPSHHHSHMMHAGGHQLHHQQQHPGRQYQLHLDHQSIQNSSNLAAPGCGSPLAGSGPMHPAQMGPHSPQQHQQQQQHNHPQSNSNQSSVQQFKWMQIKRNVPKPSGESSEGHRDRNISG